MSNLNEKIKNAISNAKELAKEKYEEDRTTKIPIEIGYFEKRLYVYDKIFFWTILFYPLKVILNDIYENKFVHNNKYWIKKGIVYGLFLLVTYSILLIVSQAKMDYIPINIFLILGVLFSIELLQEKLGHLLFIKEKEEKLSEDEIKNIIEIQQIDLNKENQKNKLKLRTIFLIFFIIANIFVFQFKSHYLATLLSLALIVGYDNYEQRYFKRDITNLFWKKRIVFYIAIIVPILIVTTFLIYDTLIFKY